MNNIFHYPYLQPVASDGRPIPNPGTPAGEQHLTDGAHAMHPWPWFTGYIGLAPGYTGEMVVPPPASSPVPPPVMVNNPFTGIIGGVFKS